MKEVVIIINIGCHVTRLWQSFPSMDPCLWCFAWWLSIVVTELLCLSSFLIAFIFPVLKFTSPPFLLIYHFLLDIPHLSSLLYKILLTFTKRLQCIVLLAEWIVTKESSGKMLKKKYQSTSHHVKDITRSTGTNIICRSHEKPKEELYQRQSHVCTPHHV